MSGRGDDDEVGRHLDAVLRRISDPRRGLDDPVFAFALRITPMINVDLLVRDAHGRTLLAWREDDHGRGWHVPGGIIRFDESAMSRVREVARLELETEVRAEPSPCDVVEIPDRSRGHFISLLYRCVLCAPPPEAAMAVPGSEPEPGRLAWCTGVPDHLYPVHIVYRDWLTGSRL